MATRFAFVDDSGETRLSGFLEPEPGGSSASVPYAEQQAAVTIDDSTYDNPITGGKLRTLVFDGEGAAIGIAQLGDAFPRYLIASDAGDGIGMGDGTMSPYFGAGSLALSRGGGGSAHLGIQGVAALTVGADSGNVGKILDSDVPLSIPGGIIQFGSGAPTVGGNPGNIYFRTNGDGSVAQAIYQCTVGGTAGNATWVGLT